MGTETEGFSPEPDEVAARLTDALEALEAQALKGVEDPAEPDGAWLQIAFMGHVEYAGYVTEITRNGQPAYHVDLPEKDEYEYDGSPF